MKLNKTKILLFSIFLFFLHEIFALLTRTTTKTKTLVYISSRFIYSINLAKNIYLSPKIKKDFFL